MEVKPNAPTNHLLLLSHKTQTHIRSVDYSKLVKMKASYVAVCTLLVLVLLAEVQVSMAVTCSPTELSSCASAITSSTPPSKLCCSKIKEQKPCLCQYLKNPNLRKLINTPNARKVASTCGTPFPKC